MGCAQTWETLFPAVLDHHLAVILAQVSDVGILEGDADLVREPAVGLLPGHTAGLVELVEIVMCRAPERAELVIGETSHWDVGAGVNFHISVALRIPAADVEHGTLTVLAVDTIRAP